MKKEISHEEKREFYKKYIGKDFQEFLEKTEEKYSKIGFISIKVFFIVGVIGLFFSPWMVFSFLPGFIIPLTTMSISYFKIKKRVEAFTENISYKDFIEMCNSKEWQKIALEIRKQNETLKENHLFNTQEKINNSSLQTKSTHIEQNEQDNLII